MIIKQLMGLNFTPEIGGGGATFLSRYLQGGTAIWVTDADGSGMPEDDSWLICVYGRDGDTMSDALFQRSGDHRPGPAGALTAIADALQFAQGVDAGAAIAAKGGAAPLSVDVSAVKRSGDGWTVTDDAHAVGYGVYIRNPLAHHIADFLLPDWQAASSERLAEAKRAAFAYADHLAEHLGCAVDGGDRPADAVPLGDLLHGAACLWEAALDLWSVDQDIDGTPVGEVPHWHAEFIREWHGHGAVHMRMMVTGWAEECERDWKRAHDSGEFDAPYDWEWVPAWLRTIAEDQDFDVSLDEMEPEDEREHAEQANEIIGDELAGGGVSLSTFSLGDVRMRPTKPGVNLHMLPSVIETSDDVSGLRPHQRDAYLNPPASMTFNPGLGKAGFGAREEVQPLDPADLVVSTLLSALADLEAVREAGEEVPALENARKAIAEGQAWRDKARPVGRIADDVVRLAGIIVAGTDLHACLSEAMDQHIYDADQGEAPDADCGYTAALKGWTDALAGITVTKEHDLTAPQGVRGRNSDNTMFHEIYGWEPSISLRDGLEKTYAWIYDQLSARA